MATLYDLTEETVNILDALEEASGDKDKLQIALDAMKEDLKVKINGYLKATKNLESEVTVLDEEIKRLTARKKELNERKNNIENAILSSMLATNIDKVETPLFNVKITKGRGAVVVDVEEDIPEEFYVIKQTSNLDKKAVMRYLEEHENVEWAHISKEPKLSIK